MTIAIDVRKTLVSGERRFELDVRLRTDARRVVLFGPSGAGKSQTLRAVAGLMRPDAGRIEVNGHLLFDAERHVWVAPQARRVAYLFQDYALFPHLTVAQNIAFGLKSGWFNPGRRAVPPAARRWVEAFELEPVLQSYPAEISGGQRQRVALARALSARPELLLLDEPFSALDATLRQKMRADLRALQESLDVPMMLITHDPADVQALGEAVFDLRDGRVVGEREASGV
ncbi:ABC transporter ATP-binding protein [Bordetella genomosp. 1]|uniref:ABC transporter ATP-binding protein n=1 Tax=Bordetella genomosp. 1 TaxID=1395607 RepID=A0A261SI31_9BORD|nr:ATP-binding cassette domain-containing protein [Bordetella genomosp. 1]OZI36602.1 ABC transporter ATP-binding protein [Bordetella genomosp. 1]OZI58061.1 ABC transporter ATP-binding protein [Bordetella genomosp. 1]